MSLDEAIQLHEALNVWYRVDGYVAELTTSDGAKIVVSALGDTPEEAIDGVKARLAQVPDIRALRAMADAGTPSNQPNT